MSETTKDTHYAAWATAWGPVGAVAGEAGLRRFVLPHYALKDLEDLLAWQHPGAVRDEAPFARLIALSRDYFNGAAADFGEVVCDLPAATTFFGKVYRACREIPHGRTMSYSDLAREIGQPDAARAVATTMSKNRIPLVVPCHRVVYANGEPGGFSAEGGEALKMRMIELERKHRGA